MSTEIEIFAASVRSTGSASNSFVVDGFPTETSAAIHVILDSEQILRLVSVLKPRIVYVHEYLFDYDASINDCLAELGVEANDDVDISPLSALKRYGKFYNGKMCLIYVAVVADGVLHSCFEEAEWYVEFKGEVENLSDRLRTVLAENRISSDIQAELEVKRKARILANDPAFNSNRPSREKRTFLAEDMFPKCDYREISQIVDVATSMDWLDKARSSGM